VIEIEKEFDDGNCREKDQLNSQFPEPYEEIGTIKDVMTKKIFEQQMFAYQGQQGAYR